MCLLWRYERNYNEEEVLVAVETPSFMAADSALEKIQRLAKNEPFFKEWCCDILD